MGRSYSRGTPEQFMDKLQQKIESLGGSVEASQQISAAEELNTNFKIPEPFNKWYVPATRELAEKYGFDMNPEFDQDAIDAVENNYGMEFLGYAVAADESLAEALEELGLIVAAKDSTGVVTLVQVVSDRVYDLDEDEVKDRVGDNSDYLKDLKDLISEEIEDIDDIKFDEQGDNWIITITRNDEESEYTVPFDDLNMSMDYLNEDAEYILNAIRGGQQ